MKREWYFDIRSRLWVTAVNGQQVTLALEFKSAEEADAYFEENRDFLTAPLGYFRTTKAMAQEPAVTAAGNCKNCGAPPITRHGGICSYCKTPG